MPSGCYNCRERSPSFNFVKPFSQPSRPPRIAGKEFDVCNTAPLPKTGNAWQSLLRTVISSPNLNFVFVGELVAYDKSSPSPPLPHDKANTSSQSVKSPKEPNTFVAVLSKRFLPRWSIFRILVFLSRIGSNSSDLLSRAPLGPCTGNHWHPLVVKLSRKMFTSSGNLFSAFVKCPALFLQGLESASAFQGECSLVKLGFKHSCSLDPGAIWP
ncbi:hypothetical protein AVEN_195514-1 [Araneus ventricosus]|uniref:Uncharacterized protein n=1 Tax=Araneus ventricosus TaxID=182803 RepID=A0A4Y2IYE5_ARAVE|nr:hypothetical protein AVEN_195514-1 [Araneus ventricosus]